MVVKRILIVLLKQGKIHLDFNKHKLCQPNDVCRQLDCICFCIVLSIIMSREAKYCSFVSLLMCPIL